MEKVKQFGFSQGALIREEHLLILSLDNISTTKQPTNKGCVDASMYIYISSKVYSLPSPLNRCKITTSGSSGRQSHIVAAFFGVCISLYVGPPPLETGRPDRSAGTIGAAM